MSPDHRDGIQGHATAEHMIVDNLWRRGDQTANCGVETRAVMRRRLAPIDLGSRLASARELARSHRSTALARALLAGATLAPCAVLLCGKYPLDLAVYRAGGRALIDHHPLYGFRLGSYGFTYPPFAALLFAPLTLVRLGLATAVLTALSLAALTVVVRLSAPGWNAAMRDPRAALALIGLLTCEPVRLTMWNGQANLLLAAAVLVDVLVVRRGVLVGLAAAVKLTPGVFVIYLMMSRRWREVASAVSTFLGVSLGAAILFPSDSARFWTSQLFGESGIGDTVRTDNQSLWGVLQRLAGTTVAGPLWLLTVIPVAAAGLRWAVRVGTGPLACGIVGVTGCVISPVSWTHHWVWCIPLLAGLAPLARAGEVPLIAGVAAFFWAYNLPTSLTPGRWPVVGVIVGNGYVLAAALLWLRFSRRDSSCHQTVTGGPPPESGRGLAAR